MYYKIGPWTTFDFKLPTYNKCRFWLRSLKLCFTFYLGDAKNFFGYFENIWVLKDFEKMLIYESKVIFRNLDIIHYFMKCTHFDCDFDTKNKNNIGTILVLMEALKKESWDFSQFNYYLLHYELSRSFTSALYRRWGPQNEVHFISTWKKTINK